MKKLFLFAGFIASLYLISCSNSSSSTSTSDSSVSKSSVTDSSALKSETTSSFAADQASIDFATKAAKGGMAEVAIGKIAAQKATSQRIKNFAMMMVTDHTKANDELKQKAASQNITLPNAVSEEDQKMIDSINMKSGKNFDKAYMEIMLNDHKKTIDLFAKEATNGTNNTLKDFASSNLPILQKHLTAVESITGIK